jgi:hypothetical protein
MSVETLEGRKLLSHFSLHHERVTGGFVSVASGGAVHLNLMTHDSSGAVAQIMVKPLSHH